MLVVDEVERLLEHPRPPRPVLLEEGEHGVVGDGQGDEVLH